MALNEQLAADVKRIKDNNPSKLPEGYSEWMEHIREASKIANLEAGEKYLAYFKEKLISKGLAQVEKI